jgi:hypothetical protein
MGLAAVPWDRRETYEAGGLGVLETPDLGRLDDEHVCGHLADAWNARQDVEPLAQARVCVAECFEASIDRFDLAVDLAQHEADGSEAEKGERFVVEALPVFRQSSATAEPGKSVFDDALGKDEQLTP